MELLVIEILNVEMCKILVTVLIVHTAFLKEPEASYVYILYDVYV